MMTEAEAPALATGEPITSVSDDGCALSADGRPHQGSDPTPAADPHRGARAGDDSASHFSATAPPAADEATATATAADSRLGSCTGAHAPAPHGNLQLLDAPAPSDAVTTVDQGAAPGS